MTQTSNGSTITKAQREYIASGKYTKDINKQYQFILSYLESVPKSKKNAIVLDLDETIFSDLCDEKIEIGGKKITVGEFFDSKYDPNGIYHPLIPGAAKFYKSIHALCNGNVFIVTGRETKYKAQTIENLALYGLQYKDIMLRSKGQRVGAFKTAARKEISKKYNVIASIGDQVTDLGEHSANNFLIVNPFYKI